MKFAKLMEKDSDLVQVARTFTSGSASAEEIASAGEKFLARLYSSSTSGEESPNQMRYTIFSKSLSKLGFELASLPPTKSAAHQHSLRTYHQVQKWLGWEKDPLEWGWKPSPDGIIPITTTMEPAPPNVINMVSCKCAKGCTSGRCSCRKIGLKCSIACHICKGQSCENVPTQEEVPIITAEDSDTEVEDSNTEAEDDPEELAEEYVDIDQPSTSHTEPMAKKKVNENTVNTSLILFFYYYTLFVCNILMQCFYS